MDDAAGAPADVLLGEFAEDDQVRRIEHTLRLAETLGAEAIVAHLS